MPDTANGADPPEGSAVLMAVSVAVRDHLILHPRGPTRVFEVLNVLASVAATVAAGTGEVTTCLRFFVTTFDQQIRECHNLYGSNPIGDDEAPK